MRSPRLSISRRRARPSAMRVRAPPVSRTSSEPRATRTTCSMVSGSPPKTIKSLLYRERKLALINLVADLVLDLHPDRVLAGVNRLLQVDSHGGGHVGLRVEG